VSSPSIPDPNKAAIAGIQADAANFPFEWMINSLAQTGGKATIGGKEYDFTGLGNADQSAAISDAMAQTMLDIQANYGPEFIKQRLANLQQSDPNGYAARKDLFDRILSDSQAHPDRPMAEDLQQQVTGMLQTAGKMDKQMTEEVQQGVRGHQVSKGIYLGNAPAAEEATATVNAADTLRTNQQDEALNYVKSGVSPEDVEYRRIQQALSNLGAFTHGQSPTAQFASVSGAQNQGAPFNPVNYQTPAATNPNAGQTGVNFANGIYQANQQQANPFTSGLSLGLNSFNAGMNIWGTQPTVNPTQYAAGAMGPQWPGYNPTQYAAGAMGPKQ